MWIRLVAVLLPTPGIATMRHTRAEACGVPAPNPPEDAVSANGHDCAVNGHNCAVNGHEAPGTCFPVSLDAQKEMFMTYRQRIQSVRGEAERIFFRSLLDMDAVRSYQHPGGSAYNVVTLDIGGTVLKAAVVRVSTAPGTTRPAFKVLNSYSIQYEPLHAGADAALEAHRWNDWVALALAAKAPLLRTTEARYAALTFSYPLVQKSLDSAVIEDVAKSWKFARHKGLRDEDIVVALNASLAAQGFAFGVSCVLNDAEATYVAGLAGGARSAQVALVLGTGVNASFELGVRDGRPALFNNEMARFEVPGALVTEADAEVIEGLRRGGLPYQELEVLIAGYKFLDIVRAQLRISGLAGAQERALTLEEVISALEESGVRDAFARAVWETALAYKHRAGKVLAAILLAIASAVLPDSERRMRIIMNGSICEHSLDREIILGELEGFAAAMGSAVAYDLVIIPDASLVGAALAAVVAGANN